MCHVPDRRKLTLIPPRGPLYRHRTGIRKKSLRYAPLTLATLASLIPAGAPVDLTLIDEGETTIPDGIDAALGGLSATTGTARRRPAGRRDRPRTAAARMSTVPTPRAPTTTPANARCGARPCPGT